MLKRAVYMPITLINEPVSYDRVGGIYSDLLGKRPYQDKNSIKEVKRLASQTLNKPSIGEFRETCLCITHLVSTATPEQQSICIDLLAAFPWKKYDLQLIDPQAESHVLQVSIDKNLPEVITYLVRTQGINVDTKNRSGFAALAWAAIKNKASLVSLLLSLGADPYLLTQSGKKISDIINKDTHREVYELLKKKEDELNPNSVSSDSPESSESYDDISDRAPLLGRQSSIFHKSQKPGKLLSFSAKKENLASSPSYGFGKRKTD
jgi:hypothetical protein